MNYAITFTALLVLVPFSIQATMPAPAPSPATLPNTARASDAYGSIHSELLLTRYPAFASEYASYQPSAAELAQMQSLEGLQVVVLFGSWCHDSEREIPRLLKLLQQSEVELSSLQLEAVNQQKQHPQQLHSQYNLRYTSTIIVLDQHGQELGRIIEKPTQSLAEDLAKIVASGTK